MVKKFFRNCPHDECTNCTRCEMYNHCRQRHAKRVADCRRKATAQAVKNKRRSKQAYLNAKMNTLFKKVTFKGIIITFVCAFVLAMFAPTLTSWFIDIAVRLEYDWGIRTTDVVNPNLESELDIDESELEVSSKEMVNSVEEDTQVGYPEVSPDEVYTATHEGPRPYPIYFLTIEEKIAIAKVVYEEARGECYEGKVAVAAVVINRWLTGDFGSSISKVISTKNQFADITYTTDEELASVPDCMRAVEDACHGWDPTRIWFEETGALYFYNPNSPDLSDEAREAREGVEQYPIGNHNFHIELNET